MNLMQPSLPNYLRPPLRDLWSWRDRGLTVVWDAIASLSTEESTAAFMSQLGLILREVHQRTGGLPALTSLLLVVNACKADWQAPIASHRVRRLEAALSGRSATTQQRPASAAHDYASQDASPRNQQITRFLASIHSLPTELRQGTVAVAVLIQYLMRDAQDFLFELRGDAAISLIETIETFVAEGQMPGEYPLSNATDTQHIQQNLETLRYFSTIDISPAQLRTFYQTGVADLPIAAAIELDQQATSRRFQRVIQQLQEHEQFHEVSRWAHSIATMLSLPRRTIDPDDLPIGGVSDVSNRGSPEHLLMTELAQPPMMLLARIALGQALYLRREYPPGPQPQVRPVFLETSIRMWGVSRLYAAAIALGVAASEEHSCAHTPEIVSLDDCSWHEEDFTNVEGVIQHLERLSIAEHPGYALRHWFETQNRLPSPAALAQPIVIVSAATYDDIRFQIQLADCPLDCLLARVETSGMVELIHRRSGGQQILQRIDLSLTEQSSPKPTPRSSDRLALPLFLSQSTPLRSHPAGELVWVAGSPAPGVFAITRDARLLWFDQAKKGGVELLTALPSTQVLASTVEDQRLRIVVGSPNAAHYLIDVTPPQPEPLTLKIQANSSARYNYEFDRGSLLRYSNNSVQWIDQVTGEVRESSLAYRDHLGGPVIRDSEGYAIVTKQGDALELHRINDSQLSPSIPLQFAVQLNSGEIILHEPELRNIYRLTAPVTRQQLRFTSVPVGTNRLQAQRVLYRSTSQRCLIVSSSDASRNLFLDYDHEIIQTATRDWLLRTDAHLARLVSQRNVLCNLVAIAASVDAIGLQLKGGSTWVLDVRDEIRLRHSGEKLIDAKEFFTPLSITTAGGQTRWKIRHVVLNDQVIFLDSRGLLHLRNAEDQSEVSLVLDQTQIGGWTSWAETFGNSYYHEKQEYQAPSAQLIQWLQEFVRRCM